MSIRLGLCAAAISAAAVAFVPAAGSTVRDVAGTLTASVGPGFTISLTNADGTPVTTLVAGTYTINVSDKASFHNFHLFGAGGLNQTTNVADVTDTTWTVDLVPGAYAYVCDPHQAGGMRGTFQVVAPTKLAAPLDTKQVVGAASAGRGRGLFSATVTAAAGGGAKLAWQMSFSHLSGAALAAHIHLGLPGRAGKVLIPLCGPCRSGAAGSVDVPAAALTAVMRGATYVNVHTKRSPGGEIRGQLTLQG